MSRITSNLFPDSLTAQVQALQSRIASDQQAIATGKRLLLPSDAPSDYRHALELRSDQTQIREFLSATQKLQQRTQANYTASTQLQTIVSRASEIGVRASGVLNASDLQALSVAVNNLLESAVSLGNRTDANGEYMFGGNYLRPGDTDPATTAAYVPYSVTRNASNQITAVTFRGNTNVSRIEVEPNASMDFNLVGTSATGTPRGLFVNSTDNVFTQLINLRDNLAAGNAPAAQAVVTSLKSVENSIATVIGTVSANLDRLSITVAAHNQKMQTDETALSQLTDADYASTVLALNQKQNSLQAALQAGAKILNLSLLNYV